MPATPDDPLAFSPDDVQDAGDARKARMLLTLCAADQLNSRLLQRLKSGRFVCGYGAMLMLCVKVCQH